MPGLRIAVGLPPTLWHDLNERQLTNGSVLATLSNMDRKNGTRACLYDTSLSNRPPLDRREV